MNRDILSKAPNELLVQRAEMPVARCEPQGFSLRAILIILAALACGLTVNRIAPPNLRVWGGIGRQISLRMADVVTYALPHLMALTLAVLVLYSTERRIRNTQIRPDTGWLVCVAAAASACILAAWIAVWVGTGAWYVAAQNAPYVYFDGIAFSVMACRLTLALAGHRQRVRCWYDWGGRTLGWLWVSAAVVKYASDPVRQLLD